jgi:hypothetical protein
MSAKRGGNGAELQTRKTTSRLDRRARLVCMLCLKLRDFDSGLPQFSPRGLPHPSCTRWRGRARGAVRIVTKLLERREEGLLLCTGFHDVSQLGRNVTDFQYRENQFEHTNAQNKSPRTSNQKK